MQHSGHGTGIGAVGRHDGPVLKLNVRQKAFVALDQDALRQGFEGEQRGDGHRGGLAAAIVPCACTENPRM